MRAVVGLSIRTTPAILRMATRPIVKDSVVGICRVTPSAAAIEDGNWQNPDRSRQEFALAVTEQHRCQRVLGRASHGERTAGSSLAGHLLSRR